MESVQISKSLIDELPNNEELKKEFFENPEKVIKRYENPLTSDKWIYRSVVWALGSVVVLCVIFAFCLAIQDKQETPQILIALGSAAVGALAGLLAPSPKDKT